MRNPKRTARTAAALDGRRGPGGRHLGAGGVDQELGARRSSSKQFTGDFVVSTQSFGFGGLARHRGRAAERAARGGGGRRRADRRRHGSTAATARSASSTRCRPAGCSTSTYVAGALDDLTDDSIQVSESQADRRRPRASASTLSRRSSSTAPTRDLTGAGHLRPRRPRRPVHGQQGPLRPDAAPTSSTSRCSSCKADGVSATSEAEAAITQVASRQYPNAQGAEPHRVHRRSQAAQIDTFVNLVYALPGAVGDHRHRGHRQHPQPVGATSAPGSSAWCGRSEARGRRCARTIRWESVITALLGRGAGHRHRHPARLGGEPGPAGARG